MTIKSSRALRLRARALSALRACRYALTNRAIQRAAHAAAIASLTGDTGLFTAAKRRYRGAALGLFATAYYAALPVRSIELPDVPAPAPRIRDAVETPSCIAALAAPAPVPPPSPSTRGAVRRRIKEAVDARTEGPARLTLDLALCYSYHASADRAAGRERTYAVAALRMRAALADLVAQPSTPDVCALTCAIEALLRDRLAVAAAHLDGIAHTIGSDRCEVQR